MNMKKIWKVCFIIVCVEVGVIFLFVAILSLIQSTHPVPKVTTVNGRRVVEYPTNNVDPLGRIRKTDFAQDQQALLTTNFEQRLKPAVVKWCKAYEGHLPFKPEDVTVDNFLVQTGNDHFHMYTFMVNGTTVVVKDTDGMASMMYVSAPEAKKLVQLPKGVEPSLEIPVSKEEIIKMVQADTGKNIDPIKVRMTPTGLSSAINGGVMVMVGGDPINGASWDYTLIFGADGTLIYYMD